MGKEARKPREDKSAKIPSIVADWRTGNFTKRDLAYKYGLSLGFVANHTKNIPQDTAETVNKLVEAKQELAMLDEHSVNAVNAVVDERTKHIIFFNNAAIRNVHEAMSLVCESQNDFKARAETISKGREVVLGKTPDTQVNIQNNIGIAETIRRARENGQ